MLIHHCTHLDDLEDITQVVADMLLHNGDQHAQLLKEELLERAERARFKELGEDMLCGSCR